jgi:KUP system potassium uptake protein
VPGSAVFITRTLHDTPPVMKWHVKMNRSLHRHLLVLTIKIESVPWVPDDERLEAKEYAPNFWRATVRYGFMERPDIPAVLSQTHALGCPLQLDDVTYYVGHETITRALHGRRLPGWEAIPFAWMVRNAAHVNDFLHLPSDSVVEIGREIAI